MQVTNSHTGTFTLTGGTLRLSAIGGGTLTPSSPVVIDGGTLQVSSNQTLSSLEIKGGNLIIDNGAVLTIDGTFSNNGGTISVSNGGRIAYTSNAVLLYGGLSNQLTTDLEFPVLDGPTKLTINNPAGVSLHASRSVHSMVLQAGVLNAGPTYTMSVTDLDGVTRIGGHV